MSLNGNSIDLSHLKYGMQVCFQPTCTRGDGVRAQVTVLAALSHQHVRVLIDTWVTDSLREMKPPAPAIVELQYLAHQLEPYSQHAPGWAQVSRVIPISNPHQTAHLWLGSRYCGTRAFHLHPTLGVNISLIDHSLLGWINLWWHENHSISPVSDVERNIH